MKLTAKTQFSWAHRGVEIERFEVGQEIDTDDADLISVATTQGWAESHKAAKPEQSKACKAAPEKKSS